MAIPTQILLGRSRFLFTQLVILFLAVKASPVSAQPAQLSLEDIFANNVYAQKSVGPFRWMKDNEGYSTLEPNPHLQGQDIIRYEAKDGTRKVIVSAEQLIPPGAEDPLEIAGYEWSTDDHKLLIFTNTRRVWRYHTRGDYWVLDLNSGTLQQLGKGLEEATLMFAKFSPDGSRVAYVSKNNIYVERLSNGQIVQVTHDGNDDTINGTFDWVYEEELNCRDGFRWSPDSKYIAYWQTDTRGTGTFYLINNIDSIYAKPIPLPYPKVGTTLSAVKIGAVAADGGPTKWFNIPGDPRNNYLARMDFIPESNDVLIQQLNRKQNKNNVWVGSVESMALKHIFTDADSAFLDLHDNIRWLDNAQYFTWTSERDGWLQLYKISRDGQQIEKITKGNVDVISINCIDQKGGYVYYMASPDNFTQRFLYRSRLDGRGHPERITPPERRGQHHYLVSNNAKWAIHTYEDATTPPVTATIRLADHRVLNVLEDNADLKAKYDALQLNPKAFIQVDIGDAVLDAWMIKPKDFDPTKKYPLLFYVYGEPASATVQDNWNGGDLWHQYLAQKGFVVMSVDNRGTKSPRGRTWRKSIYRQVGILAAKDQYAAANKILDTYPFLDRDRVGIWGWSGGGQMTMNCLFRYPHLYKTGIAVSFVSDQRLYDATYQERYMGLLSENEQGYINGSPITHAANLAGNLLIIHGTGDDNVHYQSFEMLVNELVKQNKLFSMMSYPMRGHAIYERENTSLHLRKVMEDFWEKNL